MNYLMQTGSVKLDDEWETVIQADEGQKTLTVNEIAAQTFVFFAAGFETSSTTLTFCMYELARNQDIQDQVLNEIDSVLERHGGKITYESISKMKYLDACIDGKFVFHSKYLIWNHIFINLICIFSLKQKPCASMLLFHC